MSEAKIIIADQSGWHNKQPDLPDRHAFRDLSTICIVPCYGTGIHPRVVQNWMTLMAPMNQKFTRIFVTDMEVGAAYTQTIQMILNHPDLSKWKYILTLEHDNMPPPDGLLKLYENMTKYDAIGGLYFTKGEGGKPMCYGNMQNPVLGFEPFLPNPIPTDGLVPCRGLGMGFTLFKMSMFKNPRMPKPLFETRQQYTPGVGAQAFTQDLLFFQEAGKLGYKFACDTRVKVGHFDTTTGINW